MKSIAAICLIIAIDNAISQKSTIPNIILIVTDDQDVVLKGMVGTCFAILKQNKMLMLNCNC